jgi:hypothetical protein
MGRRNSAAAVGTPVFFGMIGAILIGVFLIPMLYVTFQTLQERRKKAHPLPHEDPA